jgi:lipoprotein-anchoring transpeptidase ErfK/SrfK
LKPFGDIPTGEYTGYVTVPGKPERSYGPYRRIALDPITGDAFEAKRNGRYGLMIHGGDLSSKGALRPTHGCLRLSNADMLELLRLIDGTKRQSLRVVVAEKSSPIS